MTRPTQNEVAAALSAAVQAQSAADDAKAKISKLLTIKLRELVKPGDVIEAYSRRLGRLRVTHGNGRGARRFEVVSQPVLVSGWSVHHASLAEFRVDAYPLNEAGKRMSGRSGNSKNLAGRPDQSTVVLAVQLARDHGPDDLRSDIELILAALYA